MCRSPASHGSPRSSPSPCGGWHRSPRRSGWKRFLVRHPRQTHGGPVGRPARHHGRCPRRVAENPTPPSRRASASRMAPIRWPRPVEFGPSDSGTAAAPVIYEAAPGAKPVLSGGRAVTGWKPGPDGVWTTVIPEVKDGKWSFEQLWINGRRATRARTPNKFYHYMLRQDRSRHRSPDRQGSRPLRPRHRRARRRPGPAFPAFHRSNWPMSQPSSITRGKCRATASPPRTGKTTASSPPPPRHGRSSSGAADQRYHLENFRAALDAPGEWFLARDGTLSYIPLPGEDMTQGAGGRSGGRIVS